MMNKWMMAGVLALASSPALASKARMTALASSRHLNDFQQIFDRPYLVPQMGTLVTFEAGSAQTLSQVPANVHAEGGFLKKYEDSSFGIYLGRQSEDFNATVAAMNVLGSLNEHTSFLFEQNPVNFIYAMKTGNITWGSSLKYSYGHVEGAADRKSNTLGLSLGATNGAWEVELTQGLVGETSVNTAAIKSKGSTKLGFGYNIQDLGSVALNYKTTKVDANGTEIKNNEMGLSWFNSLIKKEGLDLFYSVGYLSTKVESTLSTQEESFLPVAVGIETDATSWLTLRGSVSQNVLLNEVKSGSSKSDVDSIQFAAGAGVKLGKGILDASISNEGEDTSYTQFAYTYMF